MTDKDLDMLANFTVRATQCLQSVEVKQNFAGNSQIIFETSHAGEKAVQKFLVAAPINITCLITEVRELNAFIVKVLAKSIEEDGETTNPISETTQMLHAFVDGRKSVATTESPEQLMNGGAKA